MAWRHGNHGTISRQGAIWKCPTCGTENTGPLEVGCSACKAGADAQSPSSPLAREAARQIHEAAALPRVHNAFDNWYTGSEALRDAMWSAFIAGAAWAVADAAGARMVLTAQVDGELPTAKAPIHPAEADAGRWGLALVPPDSTAPLAWVDARTEQTVLAALTFYRDHTLVYGLVPGQLSAEEVTTLIVRLAPVEAAL